jgi:hypothetical protein
MLEPAAWLVQASFSKHDFYDDPMDNPDYPAPDQSSCDDGPNLAARCKASPADRRGSHLKVCLTRVDLTLPCRCCPPQGEHGKGMRNHTYQKPASSAAERLPKAQVLF